jgi:hypothetical protein
MVGSIWNYMTIEQWGDASQVFNGNGVPGLPKSLEDSALPIWATGRHDEMRELMMQADPTP